MKVAQDWANKWDLPQNESKGRLQSGNAVSLTVPYYQGLVVVNAVGKVEDSGIITTPDLKGTDQCASETRKAGF